MARITVEDCLEREPNRFSLVQLASKRTKQLLSGAKPLVDVRKGNKAVVNSLREIAAGLVRFKTAEDLEREREEEERRRQAELELASSERSVHSRDESINHVEHVVFEQPAPDEEEPSSSDSNNGEGEAGASGEEDEEDSDDESLNSSPL
ncbi:MAG: DNA-directed RNA polymerase subunit omega [Bdellovibrionales bacterium]|nr:DNA-directed RNA polymerase subunit omega [Bdellovibrionales bacterium]